MKLLQLRFATLAAIAAFTCAAHASTTPPTASSYLVTHKAEIAATPAAVFAALGQPGKWWSPEHTYSGSAANLKMEMRGGGCFCETWDAGSVEHARVIQVLRDQSLRLEGSLGPLQEKAATAILTFAIAPEPSGKTRLLVTYRVRAVDGALDHSAEMVDRVLGEQVTRLVNYVEKK